MKKSLLLTFIIVGISLFQTKALAQTTIEVTNVSNAGIGSLRQAITDANSGDIIEFNSSIDGQKIILSSSISIEKDLIINGNGATNTIIDGNNQDRVFMVFKSGSLITVAINGITIQNGKVYGNNLAGAGIFNTENLTLTGCSIINNEATYNIIGSKTYGGGINSSVGVLTLINCLVTGNSCLTEGGGIRVTGNLNIINSTIVNNKAFDATAPVGVPPTTEGGGIYFAIGNNFEIYNSIVWGNFANFNEQVFGVNFIDVANNSIIEGLVISGSGNIDGTNPANAPMFLDDLGYTGNFRLQSNSLLIDKGNNTAISEIIDLDELTRVKGSYGDVSPNVDLGCYEYQFDQFVTSWKTDNPGVSNNDQITVPANTFFYTYNYSVDWGDGNSDSNVVSSITHTYATPGTYSISISGNYPNIYLSGAQDGDKLLSVISWGNNPWVNMKNSFKGCDNLTLSNTIDVPNLSNVTDCFGMFRDASSVNGGLENWDVSTITNMAWMFGGATSFNGDISSWDVSNVSIFSAMFKGATSYNGLINSWDTSSAISMDGMFQDATSFNRYIGSWDVSNVELFAYMFKDATAFNQNLGNWDVSGADSVAQMFSGATSFNQDLGNWDISGLNNSRPASIAGANNMFAGVTLSTENYDSLLIGWNSLDPGETLIPSNISFSGGNSTYCSGAVARNNLSTVKGWTITDQGSSTELPNAVCMDIIVLLDSNGNATITADQLNNGSGDSCGTATLSISNSTFNCSNLGENTVILTITDGIGNSSVCNAIVTVKDEINPVLITQNITLQLDSNGNGSTTAALINNGSSDNCEIASMSLDKTSFDCTNIGDNTVTLTVIDTSGNEATATATVVVLGIEAAFTTGFDAICRNTVINFTDTSTTSGSETITSWLWDFGDGTTSSIQNPSHSYDIPSVYVVSLTITSSNSCERTTTTLITVRPPIADFSLSPEIGCTTPHTVFFTDLSTQPDIWLWEFGDGSTSTAQNPVHNYTTYGDFPVTLWVQDTIYGCSDIKERLVKVVAVQTNFTLNGNTNAFGCGPLEVDFVDTSLVLGNDTIDTWLWDFGDGESSIAQNPTHIYEQPGVYSPTLTTTLAITGCTNVKTSVVQVIGPNVDFETTSTTSDCPPIDVQFNDLTIFGAPIVAWIWDFGDGNTSNLPNPLHQYTSFGVFDVSLTIFDIDGCSRTLVKTAFVDTTDTIAPTAICQNMVVQLDANGEVSITTNDINNGSSDNCGIASMALDSTTFNCTNLGVNTVILTVTDNAGNTDFCTATVTIEDRIDPVWTNTPTNMTVECDGSGNTTDFSNWLTSFTGSDNCGIATITNNSTGLSDDCGTTGFETIIFTLDDGNGNTITQSATFTIEDTTLPTWIDLPSDLTVECDGSGNTNDFTSWLNSFSGMDSCSSAVVSNNSLGLSDDCGNTGSETVIFTLTDECGNAITQSATFTIEDTTLPTWIDLPLDLTVECNGSGNTNDFTSWLNSFSGMDSCSSAVVSNNSSGLSDDCGNTGSETVTFTLTDECGNAITQTAIFTIEDTTAPTIICSMDFDISTDPGVCGAEVAFPMAVSLDSCGSVTVAQTGGLQTNSLFPVGVSTVEFTATDECGNTSVCSFTITITDDEPAMAVCQDITIQLDEFGLANIIASDIDGGSFDNCEIDSISASETSFDCSNIGSNNVTLTVTDTNGNISSCTAIVTVEDVTSPMVVCQNITVQLDASGTVTISGNDVDGGSTDACGIASYVLDIDTFDCSSIGDNTVVLTVIDENGNTSTCTAIVTVEDLTSPELICMNITVELDENGMATIIPSDVIESINDACGISTSAVDITEFYCSDIGNPVTVQVFAEDVNGNLSTCYATVTVVDLLAPILTCPADQTQDPGPGNLFWEVPGFFANGEAIATDNCTDPEIITTQDPAVGTLLSDGTHTVTITAEDEYGNVSTCDFELIIESQLGLEDRPNLASIMLYPNPANNIVYLSNPNQLALNEVIIYDLLGRIVNKIDLTHMGTETSIDVSTLANATYMLVIIGEKGKTTEQLIVNNY